MCGLETVALTKGKEAELQLLVRFSLGVTRMREHQGDCICRKIGRQLERQLVDWARTEEGQWMYL